MKKLHPVQSCLVIEFEWSSFFRIANEGWILVDYVTICHMAQYHRARVSFFSGEKWRRRGGGRRGERKTRKQSNIIHASVLLLLLLCAVNKHFSVISVLRWSLHRSSGSVHAPFVGSWTGRQYASTRDEKLKTDEARFRRSWFKIT